IDEVFIKGFKEKLKEKYTIQVARAKKKEEAEIIAQDLKMKIEQKVYVRQSAEDGFFGRFKIIVGDFITRENALNYIGKLREHGIEDTWILREEITNEEFKPLWIMVGDEFKSLSDNTELYFIPSNPQSYLSYKGRDYRGIFTLKALSSGIVLVNTIYIEDYLKAVVPSELSPYDFPELEALKAQAIAARTYAVRNMDSNADLGYDLGDTPKSQFYLGMNAEHPISNQAVRETKGEVAVYRGKLINALYTSTCGGRTEDVENIFSGPALPYLRSTSCVYEKQREWQIESNKSFAPIYVKGENISPEVASLISLGVIPPKMRPDFFNELISVSEAESWLRSASALLGKKHNLNKNTSKKSSFTLEMFVDMVIEMFAWQDRVSNLLLESEKDFILKNKGEWAEKTEGNAAYLIQSGILPSFAKIGSSHRALTRGEVVLYLWKVMQSYKSFTKEGIFKAKHEDKIELEMEEEKLQLALSPDIFLIRNYNGIYSFVSQLEVLGGEKVKWIETEGEVLLIEIIYPPYSNILDRSSTYHN
ncbi:MAG TPA: SpoIID/LytB domain-containing protein, partial [candidate division WOR-3 bacterium]|nr:SpoIID/LytB domain-containing protein [candidate division WOR-3 bacterium]